jgi:hypothetical protein
MGDMVVLLRLFFSGEYHDSFRFYLILAMLVDEFEHMI